MKATIRGGNRLEGEVKLSGSKNTALPLTVASLLADGETRLFNVPNINAIRSLLSLLKQVGVNCKLAGNELRIKPPAEFNTTVTGEYSLKTRYSLLLLGLFQARGLPACIHLPGGCKIGDRKFEMHLEGLKQMGADIHLPAGRITAGKPRLHGAEIELHYPTFSGTVNLLMTASLAEGETVIHNSARNPEVIEVGRFLNKMGAKIKGLETKTISVKGVEKLNNTKYKVISDRIEAATFITAAAITKGSVSIKDYDTRFLKSEVEKFRQALIEVKEVKGNLEVSVKDGKVKSVDVETSAYPGFHTDIQPMFTALMSTANGVSTIKETIYDNRFRYAEGLNEMGADIQVSKGDFKCVNGLAGKYAVVRGVDGLHGADCTMPDIRGGAALLLAALKAEGKTTLSNFEILDEGYESIEKKFIKLGAEIERQ